MIFCRTASALVLVCLLPYEATAQEPAPSPPASAAGACTIVGPVLGPSDFGVAAGLPLADTSAVLLEDGRVRMYMFAQDRGWTRRLREAVENGLTAEAAVEKVQNDTRMRIGRQGDAFLRDRLHDFDDLANRLLRELMGRPHGPLDGELPEDAIIVARTMGAAELLDYDRERLRGLVLEEGGPTSHVAIIARALDIACVGQVEDAVALAEAGDPVIVDGEAGIVHLRPPSDIETAYADKVRFQARRQEQYRQIRDEPAVTSRKSSPLSVGSSRTFE